MFSLQRQTSERVSKSDAFNAKVSRPSRTVVYPKLEVTEPGDHDEQEADAVANDVMSGKICRQISHGGVGGGMSVSSQMEGHLNSLQGGGQAIPDGLRSMMEHGFSRDFSQVRLHTDSEAASLSSSIHAKAFTHGNDIYFNQGQFSPNTSEGQKLMAHELTHVVQGTGKVGRCANNTQSYANIPVYLQSENTLIDHLISVAKGEIGYLEKKNGSKKYLYNKVKNSGNNNYVKYSKDLDQKNGVAWCDWFVHWCFVKAFNPFDFGDRKKKDNNFYEIRKNILSYTMYETGKMRGSVSQSMGYYLEKKQAFINDSFDSKIIETKYKDDKKNLDSYNHRYNQLKDNRKGTPPTPQKGDVIFFVGHIGLVIDVDVTGGIVTTIEGNTGRQKGVVETDGQGVHTKTYKLTSEEIMGYGRPDYTGLLEYLKEEYKNNKFLNESAKHDDEISGTGLK